MAGNIEAFVAKLQEEGIQAGQQAAEKLKADAQSQAEKIIADAKKQAEDITSQAKKQAEDTLSRSQVELNLAARDALLRLREILGRALGAILARGARVKLEDTEFIGTILHELILAYAKSDIEGKIAMNIDVAPEMRQKLVDWALREIGQDAIDQTRKGVSLDLKGTLSAAGFEYNVTGATVEITLESVTETLKDLVGPELRKVIDAAAGETETKTQDQP